MGQHHGPAGGDLERLIADAQESQDGRDAVVDARDDIPEVWR
jgi:hypothetical protein